MSTRKRMLSLLLVLAMAVSLFASAMVMGNAAVEQPGIISVSPSEKLDSTGKIEAVGQTTVVAYESFDEAGEDPEVTVQFKVFVDAKTYSCLNTMVVDFDYDEDYLTFIPGSQGIAPSTANASGYSMQTLSQDYNVLSLYAAPSSISLTDGLSVTIQARFKIADKEAFADLDATNPTKVTIKAMDPQGRLDVSAYKVGANISDIYALTDAQFKATAAEVRVAAAIMAYDTGKGTRDDMTAFAPKPVTGGGDITPADGTGLEVPAKDSPTGNKQIFDHWVDDKGNEYYPDDGKTVSMPKDGITFTAVYEDDKNDNGIPDSKEFTVKYTLRTDDKESLTGGTTAKYGKSYADGTSICYNIEAGKGNTIADAIPTVNFPNPNTNAWKLDGFYIGDKKYTKDELAAFVSDAAAKTTVEVEVRTYPDKNGNDIDDRENVTVKFYPYGTTDPSTATPVYEKEVPDGTYYETYSVPDPDDTTAPAKKGNVDTDPTTVILPQVAPYLDGKKFDDWVFDDTKDVNGDGKPDIVAVPGYAETEPVQVPDIVTPDPDPDKPDPDPEPVVVDLPVGGYVIFMKDASTELKRIEVTGKNMETVDGKLTEVIKSSDAPKAGTDFPARDANNNAFDGWTLKGPEDKMENGETLRVVVLTAHYAKAASLTVTDQGSNTTPDDDKPVPGFDDKKVPADAQVLVKDENGDPATGYPTKLPDDGKVVLPADEDMPKRNDNGDIFTGEWKPTTETDPTTGAPIYVFTPEYKAPTKDDIIVDVDPTDGADGNGLTILRGRYASETKATMKFYLNIGGEAATAADAARLTAIPTAAYGFSDLSTGYKVDSITYKTTEDRTIDGKTVKCGVFEVTYEAIYSSIAKIDITYGDLAVDENAKGYIVLVVADASKDGRVNSIDVGLALRTSGGILTPPTTGVAGNLSFELMDINKDVRINSIDVGLVLRMSGGAITTN